MNMENTNDPRIARLEQITREQDERIDRNAARQQREVEALKAANDDAAPTLTDVERNRMTLLDRLADRCPDLGNVAEHEVEWMPLADGDEALVLDRSGFTEGRGAYFMSDGDDVLAIGPLGSTKATGVVAIRPDGTRELRTVAPGPSSD